MSHEYRSNPETTFDILVQRSHTISTPRIINIILQQIVSRQKIDVDSELCKCVKDTKSNGLAKYLELTAFQIRYPGITSGNSTITDTCKFKPNYHSVVWVNCKSPNYSQSSSGRTCQKKHVFEYVRNHPIKVFARIVLLLLDQDISELRHCQCSQYLVPSSKPRITIQLQATLNSESKFVYFWPPTAYFKILIFDPA